MLGSRRDEQATKKRFDSQPNLFEMDKVELTGPLVNSLNAEHRYSEQGFLLGTSAFSASGWECSFYPSGMKQRDYLKYYATKFKTVEIASTYYGTPSASTVSGWYEKTPLDFIFAAKVPQIVTHEKVFHNCNAEFDEFIERMKLLGEKLGPLLFQFPHFYKYECNGPDEFVRRLGLFLGRLTDLLREHNVALALTDTSFMPRPWELKEKLDLVTADFVYVRWLGDRKGIERVTRVWDKTVVDRKSDLKNWVDIFKAMVSNKKVLKLFAFANNHYSGNAPETIKTFWNLWEKK